MTYENSMTGKPIDSTKAVDRLVRGSNCRHKSYRATAQDLTGTGISVVAVLDSSTIPSPTTSMTASTAAVTQVVENRQENEFQAILKYTDQICARGWGNFPKAVFSATAQYVLLDLGSSTNWSTNGNDDRLMFWVWSNRTTLSTDFDLELIANDGSTIKGNYNVSAITQGKWNLITLDTSADTLDDIRYIKIIMDGTTITTLYFCDFVRLNANVVNKSVYKNIETETGTIANYAEVYVKGMTTDEYCLIYINSLTNDPKYTYEEALKPITIKPIYALWILGIPTTISVTYVLEIEGEYI